MNILIVTEFFPDASGKITGGVENRAFNIAKQLSKEHSIFIATSKRPGQKRNEHIEGIEIMRYGPSYPYSSTGNLFKRMIWGKFMAMRIPFLCKKYHIEIFDANSFFSYPSAIIARMLRKKSFMTYHEVWLGRWKKNTGKNTGFFGEIAEKFVLYFASLLKVQAIAVSLFTKKRLIASGYDKDHIVVVPNGIDLEKYRGKKRKKRYDLLYVGRLVAHKRVKDLVLAVRELKKTNKNISCAIVGDGPMHRDLISLTEKSGLANNIEFFGYVKDHSKIIGLLKESKLLCHPGTVEGFGIILIEAMASSTPYVASDIDVFKEVTKNGKGGLLFKKKNPIDFATKIDRLLKDKKLYKKKQGEAQNLAKNFDWERIVQDLEEAYTK